MSGNNTYRRIDDKTVEINGVMYTDGGGDPANGSAPLYPTESTPPTGTGTEGSATPPSYVYVPGSAAPTDGDPLSYAGWLQGSTKYQAEQDRIRKEQQAQTDRQRQIVDANSAYMQGRALYGANAERMASMGLTNSGYGEYLMGKAYATQRGEVQNAKRTAQQRIDQAYYEEGVLKQQADAKYAEDLIGIKNQQNASYGALYDSAINGASIDSIMQDSRWATLTPEQQSVIRGATVSNSIKAALDSGKTLEEIKTNAVYGWDGLTVDQQNALTTYYNGIETQNNADYAALYDSALKGASIESIMQDSRWGGLSPEKQATITSVTTANSIKIRIDNGESLETIMADPASGWNDLTVDQQNTLNTYSTSKTEAKNAEIASNFERYLTAINNGSATLDDIKALPGWADMVDTDYANQLQAAWNKREHGKKFNELLRNVQNGDLTEETLKQHADWEGMSEPEKDQLLDAAKAYVEEQNTKQKTEEEEKEKLIEDTAVNKSQSEIDAAVGSGTLDEEVGNAAKDAQNKSAYNSVVTALNGGDATTIGNAFADLDKLYSNGYVGKPTYDEAKALLDSTPSGIAYQYSSGKIDVKQFVEKMVAAGYGNSGTVKGGWYVQGLGTGRENDDIDITIGGTSRNKENEFDLLCGTEVTNQNTIKALNKLATGNEGEYPSVKKESGWGNSKVNSDEKPGKIVLFQGGLYIYTKKGWRTIVNDNDPTALDKAIAAWIAGQNYDTVIQGK